MGVVAAGCTATSHPTGAATPAVTGSAGGGLAARRSALDTAITTAASSFEDGALTAAVVTPTGTWSGAVGEDGTGARLTPLHELAVGSITKTFTTAEILHLARAGALDLDAPTSRYVRSRLTANGATVRQTLSMTSGIRDGNMYGEFRATVSATPELHATPATELAHVTAPLAAIGAPGEYSNAGFLILGEVIERVTGTSYAAAIRRDLLAPAGLDRITVQTAERPTPPVAYPLETGEKPVTDGWLPDRVTSGADGGDGTIAADAPDIARWGYDLYAARTVVPAADVATMTTPVSLHDTYGLGTIVEPASDTGLAETTYGHNGLISRYTLVAQNVGYTSELLVVPGQDISVAVLAPSRADTELLPAAVALVRAAGGR